MDNYLANPKSVLFKTLIFVLFLSIINLSSTANAQENVEKTKLHVSLNLSYLNSNNIKIIKARISRKVKRKIVQVRGVTVSLYLKGTSKSILIDSMPTNDQGEAIFEITDKLNQSDKDRHEFVFKTRINDGNYEETEEEIAIKDAYLSLNIIEKDSTKKVIGKLIGILSDNKEKPIKDVEVKFYIKRTFSLLPVLGVSGLSNDEGIVTSELPLDLPADFNKTITVVARVEDNDSYGTLETKQVIPWKVPQKTESTGTRTLWASGRNAPIPLIIASVSIILAVWSILLYLIFQLFKIWKLGKPHEHVTKP
jgi:hypothetical protein